MATKLYFIVGPTAVGKTSLALETAERMGAIILSCDAYCIYRGMDIGTAKPTRAEQARVPHCGLDLVDPGEMYAVDRYFEYACGVIEDCAAQARPILVAGGSGFYLKSFFAPIMDAVEIPPSLREEVDRLYANNGLEGLQSALESYAPRDSPLLDWSNPRRVRMALMRCRAVNLPLLELQERFAAQAPPFPGIEKEVCLLERDPGDLHARIALRVDQMLDDGLIEEVAQLRDDGLAANSTAAAAIGYRESLAYLAGEIPTLEALREAIIVHTRQLARKQRTWFRKQIPVDRTIDAATAAPEIAFPSALPRPRP